MSPSTPGGHGSASATTFSGGSPGATTPRSQPSEPAAESITPIACQPPGTAWQKACTRPSGSAAKPGSAAKTTPEVPSTTESGPGAVYPDAERTGGLVTAARGDRHAVRGLAGDGRRLERRGNPLPRDLERVHDLVAPASGGDVEEQRAGRVGDVCRVLAGQPQADVVLGQENASDAGVDVGLVLAQPEELRGSEARQSTVPRQPDELAEPEAILDLGALLPGPLVVPEDGRAEDAVGVVEGDEAVHLAGEPDPRDAVASDLGERRLGRAPPVLRVLLRPPGLRSRQRVGLLGAREHLAVRGDPQRLDAGRADVEADQVGHSRSRPARAIASRAIRSSSSPGSPLTPIAPTRTPPSKAATPPLKKVKNGSKLASSAGSAGDLRGQLRGRARVASGCGVGLALGVQARVGRGPVHRRRGDELAVLVRHEHGHRTGRLGDHGVDHRARLVELHSAPSAA